MTFRYLQKLIQLRKRYRALSRGEQRFLLAAEGGQGGAGEGILAYERRWERETEVEQAIVVINTREGDENTPPGETIDAAGQPMQTELPPGTELIDQLNGGDERFTVDGEGRLWVSLPPRSARILVPAP